MKDDLSALERMEYPGRVIIVGNSKGPYVCYGLTGRSTPSQARKLKVSDNRKMVSIEVSDAEQLKKGDPALLVYDAIANYGRGLTIASNGSQTRAIMHFVSHYKSYHDNNMPSVEEVMPVAFLEKLEMSAADGRTIDLTTYEPDKNFTPRIAAVLGTDRAQLCIIKRGPNDSALRQYFNVPLIDGLAWMIATYDGENKDPLPSFTGEPRQLAVTGSARDIAEKVYSVLGEFRVSTACMMLGSPDVAVVNKHDKSPPWEY